MVMASFGGTITVCFTPLPSPPPPPRRANYSIPLRRQRHSFYAHPAKALVYVSERLKKPLSVACQTVNGNSTRSPSQEESEGIELEEKESISASSSDPAARSSADQVEAQESLGRALSELRKEKAAREGRENSGKTEEFLQGVVEETRLIEWPSLQRVLSTTGVVVSIIFGSSLVLLTVNALLAELSDVFFKNTAVLPPSPPL